MSFSQSCETRAVEVILTQIVKQKALGDLVFIELPEGGSAVTAKTRFGLVESVKAVSEVYSPVSGEVVETNSSLSETPETVSFDILQVPEVPNFDNL